MKNLFAIVLALILSVLFVPQVVSAGEGGNHYRPKKKIVKVYKKTEVTNIANHTTNVDSYENEFGAKLDAPYLIQLSENWFIGTEGGKDLYETDADQGWFAYGKLTYTGTLFSFKKQKAE